MEGENCFSYIHVTRIMSVYFNVAEKFNTYNLLQLTNRRRRQNNWGEDRIENRFVKKNVCWRHVSNVQKDLL